MTAATVVRCLTQEIFCRFGTPDQLHTDQGTQFTSELLQSVANTLGIQTTTTPAYNPKSNPVERFHRDLEAGLIALCNDQPSIWPEHLPMVLYAARCTPSRASGYSPFALIFGREPSDDLSLFLPPADLPFAGPSPH